MEDGGFDFEALDEDTEQLSISIGTPATELAQSAADDGSVDLHARIDAEEEIDGSGARGFSAFRPRYITVLSDWVSMRCISWGFVLNIRNVMMMHHLQLDLFSSRSMR